MLPINPGIHRPALNPQDNCIYQWNRILRWHSRIKLINEKYKKKENLSQYDFDDIFAFIQNCYHLRDWIKGCHPELDDKLREFFADNTEMQICRDISNGLKHFIIDSSKTDNNFFFFREWNYDALPNENPEVYAVQFADKKYELFELLEQMIECWKSFVKNIFLKNSLIYLHKIHEKQTAPFYNQDLRLPDERG